LAVKFIYSDGIAQWYCPGESEYWNDEDTDTYTKFTNYASTYDTVQFAVFNVAPDTEDPYADTGDVYYAYLNEPAEENVIAMTKEIGNGASTKNVATPYAKKLTPSNSAALDPETESYDVEIVYSETLKRDTSVDETSIRITNKSNESLIGSNRVVVNDFKWDGDTVTFKLTPSKQYSDTDYVMTLVGLVGSESNLVPDAVTYRFWRKSTVCSKVFNDGRLWMNVYGTPNLVSDSDLSVDGFKDSDGNLVSKNQRSQLMLVASKPSESESKEMVDKAQAEMGVKEDDILESSTYEIDLLLCGCVQTIPDGSYMQVAFGFPEGYGPDDAGATFKLYHYKSDGSIEEIPCVVTEYGIIATVSSFSPYAVIAVKSEALPANSTKNIYARTVGLGGEVSVAKNGTASHGVVGVSDGDTVTYTFTAESGYKPERIVLNGKETIFKNGETSVTYSYSDLESDNVLEVYFVANSVAENEAKNGITPVYASVKATIPVRGTSSNVGNYGDDSTGDVGGNTGDVGGNTDNVGGGNTTDTAGTNGDGLEGWLKAVIAVAVVLAVAAIVTVVVTLIRRRKYDK
jgi:hypothetical protein